MRVLFSSTRGTGHFLPLVPVIEACLRSGHEVLVAGSPHLKETVARTRYEFRQFDAPPEDELADTWARVPEAVQRGQAEPIVVGEIFGRLNSTAALPGLREAIREWRPDVVVRETSEYGSALAAELEGVPLARVAIGLNGIEEKGLKWASEPLDALRSATGLPPDPDADRLRESPYLSAFPASLEDPSLPLQPDTLRFRDPAWDEPPAPLPDWWDGGDRPLVYVSFGTVAGSTPMGAGLYPAAMEAVTELPVRVLMTVGRDVALDAFGPAPDNMHVEHFVPQAEVLGHAAAVVHHGGAGSTLGAAAAGRPQVVVPAFADQPSNAARVEAVGAGLGTPPEAGAIRAALERVLEEEDLRAGAERLAAEVRGQAPVEDTVALLESLSSR